MSIQLDGCAALLVDMDGVLIYGPNAAPGAQAFLERYGARVCLVTNESAYTAQGLSDKLSLCGVTLPPERIFMAGSVAVSRLARERPGARVLIRGAAGLHALAEEAGLRTPGPGETADIVLLGRDPAFDMAALEVVVHAVEDGAELWVTNPDLRHPIGGGRYTYQTGALLQAVLACLGDVPTTVIGKPEPAVFNEALTFMKAQPDDAVMIGDNPLTDGAGAKAAGVPFVLIGPDPDAAAADLADLLNRIDGKRS